MKGLKIVIIGIIVAIGVWCVLWNPIESLDNMLGDIGLTVLGVIVLVFSWVVWKKKGF